MAPEPLDFWGLFVTDDDFDTMVSETNRYATQFLAKNGPTLKRNTRFSKWVPTTKAEMKRFMAMMIAMGVVVQLDVSEYLSKPTVPHGDQIL